MLPSRFDYFGRYLSRRWCHFFRALTPDCRGAGMGLSCPNLYELCDRSVRKSAGGRPFVLALANPVDAAKGDSQGLPRCLVLLTAMDFPGLGAEGSKQSGMLIHWRRCHRRHSQHVQAAEPTEQ